MVEYRLEHFESPSNTPLLFFFSHPSTVNMVQHNMESYDVPIEGWSRAMEFREYEASGHTCRVMDMQLALARKIKEGSQIRLLIAHQTCHVP